MPGVVERLLAAGLTLPDAPHALGDYVPARRANDMVFTSGQLPMSQGALLGVGHVGADVSVDLAQDCARAAALNALAAASTVCDLDSVVAVIKVVGYVSSASGFTEQPAVINAASAVFIAAFGDAGRHAREAVGVASLPAGAPVELSVILQLGGVGDSR